MDNLTIWKQNTAFLPNLQTQSTTIGPFTNLEPGQEYTTSIRQTCSTIPPIGFPPFPTTPPDEQDINDDVIGYVTPFNLYDPVESIEYFNPMASMQKAPLTLVVTTNNYGNTPVDFGIEATVYSAMDPPTSTVVHHPPFVKKPSRRPKATDMRKISNQGCYLQREQLLDEDLQQQRLLVRPPKRHEYARL